MRNKTSLILVGIMVALLLFVSVGVQAQENPEDVPLEDLETPSDLNELIDKFHMLEYHVVVYREGEKAQDNIITYQYQGSEEVQGVETDVLSFSTEESAEEFSSLQVWYDGEEVKQMEVDGEIIPAEMAEMMSQTILQSVMFPFYNFANFPMETYEDLGDVSESREMVFDREVDVYTVEIQDRPELEIESSVTRLANFEEFMMVLSYAHSSSEEDMEIQFSIEALEFR